MGKHKRVYSGKKTNPNLTPGEITEAKGHLAGEREHDDLRMVLSHEYVTLRKLALVTGADYSTILNAAKQPVVGLPYDPAYTNCSAIERVIRKALLRRGDINSEQADVDWENLDMRMCAELGTKLVGHKRKVDMNSAGFSVGTIVMFLKETSRRQLEGRWELVYSNDFQTCIRKVDEDELRIMSNVLLIRQARKIHD